MTTAENTSVLIVEDDESIRTSLSMLLSESGYRVRSAEDGFSALLEIRAAVPDVILSDLQMPGMSGFELLSVVRLHHPGIKVIAMSGAYSGDVIPPGVTADHFHAKGKSVGSLLQTLEALSGTPPTYRPQCSTAVILCPEGQA